MNGSNKLDFSGMDARRVYSADEAHNVLTGRSAPVAASSTGPLPVREPGLSTADIAGRVPRQEAKEVKKEVVVAPVTKTVPVTTPATATGEAASPLFAAEAAREFRAKWDSIQVRFVDEPRQSVEEADHLVASTIKRLAEIFADERQRLESQWDRGESVSTEELRLSMQRYRSFFGRLLAV